ncbi:MAG: LamG-like jellyroll fold domain-containing protein, partial [Bacteroidota bacterium]|nr:LamG-like jellyroll fold domain-containing protein [Bacteroidota bacterium]
STSSNIAYWDNTPYSTLSAWKSADTTQNVNSINIIPDFNSSTDLKHTNGSLNAGQNGLFVTNDIYDTNRVSPTLGAYEYVPAQYDAGITELVAPTIPLCLASQNVIVILKNNGLKTLTSDTIQWMVNGVAQTPYAWTGSLATNDTTLVNLGSYSFNSGTIYNLKVYPSYVNGTQPDSNALNDTLKIIVQQSLSGTYTIGGASRDFHSFNDAINALDSLGLCGAVTFIADSGVYNEQLTLKPVMGASLTKTITFQSATADSSDVVITNNGYVVKLNGADYFTFKNLSFVSTDSYSNVVEIENSACNNNFYNNLIIGHDYEYGQTSGFSSYTYIDSNITIKNNRINNCYNGIYLKGIDDVQNPETNIIISGNYIENFRGYGILVYYDENVTIESNTIISNTCSYDYSGIFLYYCSIDSIVKNKIKIITNDEGAGINISQCYSNTLFANNSIAVGSNNSIVSGIEMNNCNNFNVFNNSVNIISGSSNSRAFYSPDDIAYCSFKNNIFNNNSTGLAVYFNSAPPISDYNSFYTNGSYLTYVNSSKYSSLSAYQTATNLDSNSVSAKPNFRSSTDLHLMDTFYCGITLNEVKIDIDGDPRQSPPQMGADEFNYGPLFGTYTIKPDSTGNYINFTQAVSALNQYGVKDKVTFIADSGVYNEQIKINYISGASSSNTVTFRSESGNNIDVSLQFANTSTNNYVIKLDSAKYVSFEDMTIKSIGTSYGRVIHLSNYSDNNTFDNNIINGISTYQTSNNYALIYSKDDKNNYNTFLNNTLFNGSFAFYFSNLSNQYSYGTEINGNNIIYFGLTGIFIGYQKDITIQENFIKSDSSSPNGISAISTSNCNDNLLINGNKIDVTAPTTSYGIHIYNHSGSSSLKAKIFNNFIHLHSDSSNTVYGMNFYANNYSDVFYNTINITGTNSNSRGIHLSSGSNCYIKNNIFANNSGGYAYYVGQPSIISESDYNDFYTTGTNLVYWNGNKTSLSAYQSASSKDSNSFSVDPEFVSESNLHIISDTLNEAAIPITGIDFDIDGQTRDAINPDIGADEYEPPLAGVYTIGQDTSYDYQSFSAAAHDLNNYGIKGNVKFKVDSGNYNEQFILNEIQGATDTSTIVFESMYDDSTKVVITHQSSNTAGELNYIVKLDGADYITFRKISFFSIVVNSGLPINVILTNAASNNNFENCYFSTNLEGYDMNSPAYSLVLSYTETNTIDNNNSFISNYFRNAGFGLTFYYNPSFQSSGNVIQSNVFEGQSSCGIYCSGIMSSVINENIITTDLGYESNSNGYNAIYCEYCDSNFEIGYNKIEAYADLYYENESRFSGIYLSKSNFSTKNALVHNNFINMTGYSSTSFGVIIDSTYNVDFVYNTVRSNVYAYSESGENLSSALNIGESNNIFIRNNILSSLYSYAIATTVDTNHFNSDYNVLYSEAEEHNVEAGSILLANYQGSVKNTLSEWQNATANDINSLNVDPYFNNFDPYYKVKNMALNGAAIPLDSFQLDIEKEQRHLQTPDIGCDEFLAPVYFTSCKTSYGRLCDSIAIVANVTGDSIIYSWYVDGSLDTNSTDSFYSVNNVSYDDGGNYICVASNDISADTCIHKFTVYTEESQNDIFYKFSGNANNSSGNYLHGVNVGATSTHDRFLDPDSAYYFDGINDYVYTVVEDSSDAFTVSSWIKISSSSSSDMSIFSKGNQINFYVNSSNKLAFDLQNSLVANKVLSNNRWYFVTMTFKNGLKKIYINGEKI